MKRNRNILRRWRRITLLILVIMLLACLLCCALLHRALAAEIQPGWDILFVIDSSNSMPASYGAVHAQTQELLTTYLDAVGRGTVHRVWLIRFGTQGRLEIPLTDTAEILEQRTLPDVWENADALGWTDPLQALDLAYETLTAASRSRPAQRQAVILVTDGEPALPTTLDDADARAAYTEAIRNLAARFKRQEMLLFTLTLGRVGDEGRGRSAYPTPYRTLWQELAATTPPASYHELLDVEALPSVYHEIVAQLLGYAGQATLAVAAAAAPSQTLQLAENLQRAVVTVYAPEANAQIALQRPGGAPVRAEDPDVHLSLSRDGTLSAVYVIERPRPGRWMLTHSGESRLQMWIDGLQAMPSETQPAYRLRVTAPDQVLVGTPFDVRCRLIQDGDVLPARGDVQIKATLLRAGFSERQILAHARDDEYLLRLDTLAAGTYTLLIQAVQAGSVESEYETLFAVVESPRLQVTRPVSGQHVRVGTAITMDARIGVPPRPMTAALDADSVFVTGALQSPNGVTESLTLTRDSARRYVRVVTPTLTGSYSLTLRLQGLTVNGLPYADQLTLPFHVLPPATDPSNPWPWIWITVLTTLTGMGGWMGWRRWQQRPRLEGRWRLLQAPAGRSPAHYLPLPATRQRMTLDQTYLPGVSASQGNRM